MTLFEIKVLRIMKLSEAEKLKLNFSLKIKINFLFICFTLQ